MAAVFCGTSLTELGTVYIQKLLIDDVFLPQDFGRLPSILLLLALICLFNIGFNAVGAFAYTGPYSRISSRMADDLLRAVHALPIQEFQKERTAVYVNHMTIDIPRICEFSARTLPQFAAKFAMLAVLLLTVGSGSLPLIIVMIIVSAVYSLLTKYYHSRMQRMNRDVQSARDGMIVTIEEGIASTREVLANYRMEWEEARYRDSFHRYLAKVMEQGALVNRQLFASEPIRWGALLAVLGFGGYLVLNEGLSIGTFVVIYSLTQKCMDTCNELFEQVMRLSENMGYVERLRRMLERESEPQGDLPLKLPVREIRFNSVQFAYGPSLDPVLKELTLHIPAGKIVGFVGMSGGGKSTIAGLLIRYYEPLHGVIEVDGMPLQRIRRQEWHRVIDIVFQEPYLFPGSIRLNLTLGLEDIATDRLMEICRLMGLDDAISSLPGGLDAPVGERGIILSGGQRQRLALARAMLVNPDILILDEATSALDLETERIVQRNLEQLRAGKTTIIIAHRLSTVRHADLIHVMDKGRIAESGTHEELLLADKLYSRMMMQGVERRGAGRETGDRLLQQR
nr:ABC transporter ATP-binding protein [Paenibacillus oenotherae]